MNMSLKLGTLLLLICWLSVGAKSAAIADEAEQLMADESGEQVELEPRARGQLASQMQNDDDQDSLDEEEQASWAEVASKRLGGLASDELEQQDTNIENAKVQMSPNDMVTAAGHHHHHHGHYVHGKLDMGAHTSKKGAFGWHAKYPVGGKGRK